MKLVKSNHKINPMFNQNYLNFYFDNLEDNLMRVFSPKNTVKLNIILDLLRFTEFDHCSGYKLDDDSGYMFNISIFGNYKFEEYLFDIFDKTIKSDYQLNFHSYIEKQINTITNDSFYMLIPRRDYIEFDFNKTNDKKTLEFLIERVKEEGLNLLQKNNNNFRTFIASGFEHKGFELFYSIFEKYKSIGGIKMIDFIADKKESNIKNINLINSYILNKKTKVISNMK